MVLLIACRARRSSISASASALAIAASPPPITSSILRHCFPRAYFHSQPDSHTLLQSPLRQSNRSRSRLSSSRVSRLKSLSATHNHGTNTRRLHTRFASSSTSSSSSNSDTAQGKEHDQKEEENDTMTQAERAIYDKLTTAFDPSALHVQDISGGCGSMYALEITSARFRGLSVVKQHKLVNGVLEDEIRSWHGVQLRY